MSSYYYLDVSLKIYSGVDVTIDKLKLKTIILQGLQTLFGECGSAIEVDLLKFRQTEKRAILRCLSDSYVKTMTTYRRDGKDVIIFATADDHKEPSKVILPEPEPQAGLILPNGEINWNCPCLGGMASGPCGIEFREAFSCFHNSEADPKGSDCYNAFKEMHLCMAEYPALYKRDEDDDDRDIDLELEDENSVLDKKIESKVKERVDGSGKDSNLKDTNNKKTASKLKETGDGTKKHDKANVNT